LRDLGGTNGTKVNGSRISSKKLLRDKDQVSVANHRFTITYTMPSGQEVQVEAPEEDMNSSLLEKAGLVRPHRSPKGAFRPKVNDPTTFLMQDDEDDEEEDD